MILLFLLLACLWGGDTIECHKCKKRMVRIDIYRITLENSNCFEYYWWCKCGNKSEIFSEKIKTDKERASEEWEGKNELWEKKQKRLIENKKLEEKYWEQLSKVSTETFKSIELIGETQLDQLENKLDWFMKEMVWSHKYRTGGIYGADIAVVPDKNYYDKWLEYKIKKQEKNK